MATKKSMYYENLSDEMKILYDSKIYKCGGVDPYTLKENDLSVNRSNFPDITLLDIGNYMIYSVSSHTKRAFKAYKSMEAYKFFESGYVLTLRSKKTEKIAILIGKVQHSQKMNKAPHKVWLLTQMEGEIICGNCTCVVGLSGTCSHVGALCFFVMNIAESPEAVSVTDLLCKWSIPKFKDVSMSSVRDIQRNSSDLREPTTTPQDFQPTFHADCDSLTVFTYEEIEDFVNLIHSDGQKSALRFLKNPDEKIRAWNIKDQVFLADLYSSCNKNKSLSELIKIGRELNLQISSEELKEIAQLTESKNKSNFWLALRRGRVTGCCFKDCCVTNVKKPSITTINRIINPMKYMDQVPSINYQRKNKKKALNCYLSKVFDENHEQFVYKKSGLIINASYPYFAVSTDGIVYCDCHGKGCVEIKCLKVLESSESFDVLTRKPKNILNKINENFSPEKDHELYYKLQMQIYVSEVQYCDLVIWSPNNTLILRVDADINFWNEAKEKAIKFHEEVMMPELLGKFFTEPHESYQSNEASGAACQSEENFQVIGLEIEHLDSEDE